MTEFDVIVIGAGSGGYTAALELAGAGKKVALLERDRAGGTCLLRGCIPSKALIHAADAVYKAGKAGNIGVKFGEPDIDMAGVQEWKRTIIDRQVAGIEAKCKKLGVEIITGSAKLTSVNEVEIDGRKIAGQDIIIATGAVPGKVPGFGVDGQRILGPGDMLDITEIPLSLCVIGGGVIGLEMATFAAKLGSKVTVIELLDDILPFTDPDAKRALKKGLKELEIGLHTGTRARVRKITDAGVELEISEKEPFQMNFEKVLVAVGSRPNTMDLGLENTGVEIDERGTIMVDENMRTSVPNIYAIGDVRGEPMLAHKASMDAIIASQAILDNSVRRYPAIPYTIFTEPELATVGITEIEVKETAVNYTAKRFYFAALGKALAMDETDGFVKLIVDENKVIIGGAVVGPDASNLISEITLAVEKKMTADELSKIIHAHPTLSEAIWELSRVLSG